MGLLGLAFHPNFEQNGYFYVNYTGEGGHTRISRFQANGDSADPNSEQVLMIIDQPFPNHNGGAVVFGPDGYLYLGLGDGGAGGDPQKNGQNTDALLGKILRIDVDNGDPYSIPADNPFGNEVWAYGLRNPWRISFDRVTGDLWIGDVARPAARILAGVLWKAATDTMASRNQACCSPLRSIVTPTRTADVPSPADTSTAARCPSGTACICTAIIARARSGG
jgi:hypothetical protein